MMRVILVFSNLGYILLSSQKLSVKFLSKNLNGLALSKTELTYTNWKFTPEKLNLRSKINFFIQFPLDLFNRVKIFLLS